MGIRFLLVFCILLFLFVTSHARLAPFAAHPPGLGPQDQAHPPAEKEQSLPIKTGSDEGAEAPAEEEMESEREKHHSRDRSMAGGGVIIGGLATAIFAAVYCYIRVTRKTATAPAPAPASAHPQPQPQPQPPK